MPREIPQVEVRPFGWSGRFCIFDDTDGWFLDKRDNARTYTRPGSAVTFLRRTEYPWIVKMPSGRTLYVNCDDPANKERWGPHSWGKANLVTMSDRSGMYDVWECAHCHVQKKRYGLAGSPALGVCKKNPRQ